MEKKKNAYQKKQQRKSFIILAIVMGLFALWFANSIRASYEKRPERISYQEYTELLNDGKIDMIMYNEESEFMFAITMGEEARKLSEEEKQNYNYKDDENSKAYSVIYPEGEDFKKELLEKGIIVRLMDKGFESIVERYGESVIYLLFIVFLIIAMRKASPLANSNFNIVSPSEIEVSFDDVIGHEEIKDDLKLIVKQLQNGEKAKNLSHGILFEGSPGTGKTMLAKAIAHSAGANFISVSSSNFVEMYVGLGARRVRDCFKQARKVAPCVLFFDEIDAIGSKRGNQRSHRENDQTLNALLTELDGFDDKGDIVVIAATNLADELDEALLRSGRFDRRVHIQLPQKWETRQEMFEHYLKDKTDDSVDTESLSKQTVGFSGADIASVCREAGLIAFREDSEKITQAFLEEAIDKIVFKGNRSNEEQRKEDIECVAYHEAGHAVMTYLQHQIISRISILGMTSGVGGAVFSGDNERIFYTKAETKSKIMIAFAGRASESIHYGEDGVTQGAENDITQATKLLQLYVTKLGFDKQTGLIDTSVISNIIGTDSPTSKRISELSNEFYGETVTMLKENYHLVDVLAKKLMECKTLSGNEAEELLQENSKSI